MKTKTIAIAIVCMAVLLVLPLIASASAANQITRDSQYVTVSIHKGWNLVPIKLLNGIAGRYWDMFRSGKTTCNQDVARDVFMWSPVNNRYENFVIDDWDAPAERNNNILVSEFSSKSFSAFYGSAWVYSGTDCTLAYDSLGTSGLATTTYGSELEPSKNHNYADLTLKRGWNFIPIDVWMTLGGTEATGTGGRYADIFANCQVSKVNYWEADAQVWYYKTSAEMTSNAQRIMDRSDTTRVTGMDVFQTLLVKTEADCKLSMTGSTAGGPPAIPQ